VVTAVVVTAVVVTAVVVTAALSGHRAAYGGASGAARRRDR